MSTFTLPATPTCKVHLPPSLSRSDLEAFPAWKTWTSTLQHSLALQRSDPAHPFRRDPYALRSVEVQSADWFGSGDARRLGFVKARAVVENGKGEGLPGSVLLRGGSVALLVLLHPTDSPSDTDAHALLTLQPRIPAASLAFPELPAGMLDDAGAFSGAAARELHEETGLAIAADELVDLTALALSRNSDERLQKGMYPSAGGCDEFVPVFLCRKRVARRELGEWCGRLTGLRDEGERITLRVVPLRDLWREGARDAKALAAWALYEGLKREGRLPEWKE